MSRNISPLSVLSVPIRRWRSYRAWSPAERQLFRRCLIRLIGVRMRLHRRGFVATRTYYRCLSERSGIRPEYSVVAVDHMVRRSARLLPGSTCLVRALSVWSLLREQGTESSLRIGVNRRQAALNAHAWVEIDNQALDEGVDAYAAFPADTTEASMR